MKLCPLKALGPVRGTIRNECWVFKYQQIKRNASDDIICKGKVEVCFYDQKKNKPIAFPKKLLKIFKK